MTFAPAERYANSRALADDIERWTAGQPVSAWYEPWSRRMKRWARRGQTAVAALAAAALVALAGSAYVRNRAGTSQGRGDVGQRTRSSSNST